MHLHRRTIVINRHSRPPGLRRDSRHRRRHRTTFFQDAAAAEKTEGLFVLLAHGYLREFRGFSLGLGVYALAVAIDHVVRPVAH